MLPKQIADRLRALAQELDQAANVDLRPDLDIKEAIALLSDGGNRTVDLHIEFDRRKGSKTVDVNYVAWDGSKHHRGKSLSRVVQETLGMPELEDEDVLDSVVGQMPAKDKLEPIKTLAKESE